MPDPTLSDPTRSSPALSDPDLQDPDLQGTPAPLRYRVLTGPDDRSFCERVSAALEQGYELHGSPALTHDGTQVIVAQALVRPAAGGRSPALTVIPV